MPGETGDLAPGSLMGVWAPKLNTFAAAAGWPGGGPELLPLLCHTLAHKQKHINVKLHFKNMQIESRHSPHTDLLPPAGAASAGLGWRLGG